MPANAIKRWIDELLGELQRCRQRQLLVLQGPRDWCDAGLCAIRAAEPGALLISDRHADAIAQAAADACLGGETRLAILDLFDGLDPDLLCIAAGLVRAGGALLLLSPPLADWDLAADRYACWQDGRRSARPRFVEYFFSTLERDPQIGLIYTPREVAPPLPRMPRLSPTPLDGDRTAEQATILRRLGSWLESGQTGLAVISAARGRGKSTCLGLLAGSLQDEGGVLVSARSRQSAALLLGLAPRAEFFAPDRLLDEAPPARLLLVDEAAAIPLSLLRQLIRLYPRCVMATTTGGYEGTGRGFMLRFLDDLATPQLLHLEIEDPVRWCRGDLLEGWLERSLMLDADAATVGSGGGDCELQLVATPDAADESLLAEVFVLLNSAHYRTRPSDLRMLMENPDLALLIARQGGRVVGALLLNREGGFDAALCEEVFLGRRRPRGHLLAQMLTSQAGIRGFAARRGLRVLRIAVAQDCRRRGFGGRLIEAAVEFAHAQGFEYLGASFALDPRNADFWRRTGFRLVHVGYAQGKSSGEQSVAVLRPVGDGAGNDCERMQRRVREQLPVWLTQFLQRMEHLQVAALLRLAAYRADGGQLEDDDVVAFTSGHRGFELCFASLQKYVMERIARAETAPDPLLIEKALQNRPWERLARESGAEGRRQLLRRLRAQVAALDKA